MNGLAKIKGVVSTTVEDGPNKLYLGNLPNHLGPEQVNHRTVWRRGRAVCCGVGRGRVCAVVGEKRVWRRGEVANGTR